MLRNYLRLRIRRDPPIDDTWDQGWLVNIESTRDCDMGAVVLNHGRPTTSCQGFRTSGAHEDEESQLVRSIIELVALYQENCRLNFAIALIYIGPVI